MAWSKWLIRSGVQFLRASWQERQLFLEALLLLSATALALRVIGFRRWQSFLARRASLAGPRDGNMAQTLHLARLAVHSVRRASRYCPWPASCLQQSLTLVWLLYCRRIDSQLRIGVRKEGGRFEAHAWVEHRGVVLYDPGFSSDNFVPFDCAIAPLEVVRR
jgi:hypothetical protein